MKYLVVETYTPDGKEFTHFIELTKSNVEHDMVALHKHLVLWKEVIRKVYFSNSCMSNW